MKRVNRELVLIGVIIFIALVIRIWGISYDLPYIYHPDEPVPIGIGYNMLITGDFNPHFFDWPSLIIYINLFIQGLYLFLENIFGGSSTATNPLVGLAMGVVYSPKPIIVLLGRLTTVTVGIGTILPVIWSGKGIFKSTKIGALAGLMMTIVSTNVALNRFITPDSYATFFLTIVLLASISIYRRGQTWAYIVAGVCLGLAVSSKYNTGLIIIVFFVGHFLRTGWRGYKDYRLYLVPFLGSLTFAATTPYALLDFHSFYAGFSSTGKHYAAGHAGMEGDTLRWYLTYMWRTAGIVYILAALAIVRGIYMRSKEIVLLAVFPIVYFAFISSFTVRNDRTFLPLTPFLFLLAASLFADLFSKAKSLSSKLLRRFALSALVCLLVVGLIIPIRKTIMDTFQLTTVNSREAARVWIDDNLPLGSKIAIESYSPFVEPARFSVQGFGRMIEHDPEWYVENGFEYLIFSQGMYGRFYHESEKYPLEVAQYDGFFNRFELIKTFIDGNYEVRIYRVM